MYQDLDHLEENVVQDIMTEISIPMTIEEEISELQQNGLLDLDDHSGLPCMPGIEATDVGSLLEQFEEGNNINKTWFKALLKLSVLGEYFSKQHFEIFSYFFSQKIGFDISCKLSP